MHNRWPLPARAEGEVCGPLFARAEGEPLLTHAEEHPRPTARSRGRRSLDATSQASNKRRANGYPPLSSVLPSLRLHCQLHEFLPVTCFQLAL
ncbi:hypothetical protein Dimus_013105 [Dionaea muscipula]